jgi:hypothetical protein
LQDLLLLLGPGLVQYRRHIGQVGMLVQPELHEHIDLALVDPLPALGGDSGP